MPRDLPYPAARPPYPVQLDGELDPELSRWKWLVKWFLAIPHLVVLVFLWLGFVLTSIVALVMIVVTGHYPRPLFDFNVGVMRWTWRVGFYAFNAIGTDRYPPFSLAERPDYPARLSVAYPERLNRGLALVKWWLLAIPHYVLVAVFIGGILVPDVSLIPLLASPGSLVSILALFAGVALLFTARYPSGVFSFVVGLNRWAFRTVAYAALMRDEYPPFRLER